MQPIKPVPEKALCVIDQSSVRFLCEINLERMSLIRWLTTFFRTYIPADLFDQTYDALRNVETRELLKSEVDANNIIKTETPEDCYRVMMRENELGRNRYKEYGEAHEGELKCAAVALELSRKHPGAPVYLFTDDLKARSIISYIFQKQQIGTVLSSFDFLIYLFVRQKIHWFQVRRKSVARLEVGASKRSSKAKILLASTI